MVMLLFWSVESNCPSQLNFFGLEAKQTRFRSFSGLFRVEIDAKTATKPSTLLVVLPNGKPADRLLRLRTPENLLHTAFYMQKRPDIIDFSL